MHATPHYEPIFILIAQKAAVRRRQTTLIAVVKKRIALLITSQTAITRRFYCVVNSLSERFHFIAMSASDGRKWHALGEKVGK